MFTDSIKSVSTPNLPIHINGIRDWIQRQGFIPFCFITDPAYLVFCFYVKWLHIWSHHICYNGLQYIFSFFTISLMNQAKKAQRRVTNIPIEAINKNVFRLTLESTTLFSTRGAWSLIVPSSCPTCSSIVNSFSPSPTKAVSRFSSFSVFPPSIAL